MRLVTKKSMLLKDYKDIVENKEKAIEGMSIEETE